jgi:phosphate transport system protein
VNLAEIIDNIAQAATRYLRMTPVKPLVDLPRMGEISQGMLRDALDSFVRKDVRLAQSVLTRDDMLDDLKTQVFRDLLTYMLQDPAKDAASLELILVSRHLERNGDHATNVAEDVIFMVSAKDVRHMGPPTI